TFTLTPFWDSLVPYVPPASTILWARIPAAAASRRKLMNPGPATSALAMPSTLTTSSAIRWASSRGFVPSFFASCMATFDAQSPWSRLRGRSSTRSPASRSSVSSGRKDAAIGATTARMAAARVSGFISHQVYGAPGDSPTPPYARRIGELPPIVYPLAMALGITRRKARATALCVALATVAAAVVLGIWRPWIPAVVDAQILASEEVVMVAPTPLVLPEHPHVLVFGDSWTYGSAASEPTLGYAYLLADALDGETTVDGIRGSGYLRPGIDGPSF